MTGQAAAGAYPTPDDDRLVLTSDALRAANINPKSYLATDYLNHYNEVLMLLEMLPSMPDMLDEILSWQPKSYPQHFEDTGFSGKKLAIASYHSAPMATRRPFDLVISHIDGQL